MNCPDLFGFFVFLFVFYLAVYWNPIGAMFLGFGLGLLQDTLAWSPFGLSALFLTGVAYFPHLFRSRLYLASLPTQLAFVCIFTLAGEVLKALYFFTVKSDSSGFFERFGIYLVWNALFYLLLFRWWTRTLRLEPHRGSP